jgi:hypothetical protein
MADLLSTIFQFSNFVKLDRTKQERWITETHFRDYSLVDSLGNRSRVLRVTIHNPGGGRSDWYQPMTRVRLLENYGVIAFLGRVISVNQDYSSQTAIITCRDYLDDIADRTVEAVDTSGTITTASRSAIVNKILENDTYTPTLGDDLERTFLRRLKVDPSVYGETLSRNYSQRGNYQTVTGSGTTAVGANYQFRGVKTGLEAISDLASEDPQQDLMAFYYTASPTDPSNSNHTTNPQQYPRTYWTDLTRTIVDGNTHFVTPQTAQDTATPSSADILYFGSNSKFDGIRYTFLTHGPTIENGAYAGNLQWQFWNGTAWTSFTPTADAKFNVDSGKIYGTTYWTLSNLADWGKRDLGTTPDMPTGSTLNWAAPWATSGTTLHEDVDSAGISKVDHGDVRRSTNKYWVRVYVRTGSITVGKVLTVELYTKPALFHDFRCEDPQYFSEVWRYVHVTGSGWDAGRDGPGGTWTALNTTGLNDGTGTQLLWNANQNSAPFINGATETFYFGSEYPFNGVQFHSVQQNVPNYSNIKFVWQFYDPYYAGAQSEPWQTISGLTISANTLANPTAITTERHHLQTGDSVTISGSNSTPSINGTHTVYVDPAYPTIFTVPVNVTTAGTAGHVVCNNRITASQAMASTGDAAWMRDIGSGGFLSEYYLDVRWDTGDFYPSTANEFATDVDHEEFNKFHMLDDYMYLSMVSGKSYSWMKYTSGVGTNSISAANPTVITSADGAGGSTENHNLKTGDKVFIRGSNSTPSVDGVHTITKVSANTFSIPVNVTSAGNTATLSAFTTPPSSRVLYWVRCYITSGTPTNSANIRDVRTAPVGMFKYFDRGKEPWVYNANTTVQGTTATRPIQYCYRYDTSASAGSKFTDYSQEISSSTSGASNLRVISNTLANPTVITTNGPSLTISSNTAVTTTVITTSAAHGLTTEDIVVITNSNSTPSLNGTYAVTVISTTTFSVPVYITSAGSAGTVVPNVLHDLTTGHKVVITNSNSTPSINGTHTVTVLSTTTFSVAVNVTTAGTAGTVVPEKIYAMDNGQIGDALYFGMDEPFTSLRLNVSDVLSSSSSGQSGIVYEYFLGGGTDNWATISHFDETGDFTTSGTNEVTFDKPAHWKTCQPGIKEANGTDQSFGRTAYYVRAKLATNTGSPATSAAKIVQGWVGPNLWNPGMEVGTLSGVTSVRHSDPATYGVTLIEEEVQSNQNIPIAEYALNEKPIDFINKVSVRGRSGAYGVAQDDTSIAAYGLVKERTVDDSTLTNSLQCETRARSILEQLKPENNAFFRECKIRTLTPPVYTHLSRPQIIRAGDRVNVTIESANITNEKWLVYSILCSYMGGGSWSCEFTLFRDMTSVFEPGTAERRLLRDLATRTRETANAVFQPLDKAVVSGLDFLPEGPGRFVGREEYGPIGTELGIYPTGSGTLANYTSEFRWTKKLYSNHNTKETLDTDLMRISHDGINPEEDGVAQGGAGLTFIARDKRGSGSPDFHPGTDEATLYLRNSGTVTEGSGLYLAHRDVFNSGATYDEWVTDTPKINAEVMTGFTGFVDHTDLNAGSTFIINLPALDSAPLVFTSICGHEGSGGSSGNWSNAFCNVFRWTTSGGKYTAVEMRLHNLPESNIYTGGSATTITAISVANPTVITTTASISNGRAVIIGQTNSTPVIDGLYHLSNKAGSNPYTYTLTAFANTSFPVNVTSAGTDGKIMSMNHTHSYDQSSLYDYSDDSPHIGIMYMVVFNSGKNTTGLNAHFSQNHTNHG